MGPLQNEGDLVTEEMEKAGLLNAFFTLVINITTSLLLSQVPETSGKLCMKAETNSIQMFLLLFF